MISKFKNIVFIFLFTSLIPVFAKDPMPNIPGKWKLVFNEEFNQFDKSTWSTGLETGKATLRRSACFFRDANVKVANGNLMIITKKEKLTLTDKDGKSKTMKYTSGFVHSFRKFKQRYGYFEARIKVPKAKGLWPAFWLMPDRSTDGVSPMLQGMRSTYIEDGNKNKFTGKGMEIDIMEHLTEWNPSKFHYAAHWDGFREDLKSHRGSSYVKTNPDQGYRKFGLYWAKDLLAWYVDDIEIARWQNERIADVPMYIIFSTNVGGWATDNVNHKALPDCTYIDYVRVWEEIH